MAREANTLEKVGAGVVFAAMLLLVAARTGWSPSGAFAVSFGVIVVLLPFLIVV